MSRIEEALKRAREAAPAGAATVPPAELFQDPWAIDAAPGESPSPQGLRAEPREATGDGDGARPGRPAGAPVSEPAQAPAAAAHQAEQAAPPPEEKAEPAAGPLGQPPAGIALFQGFDPNIAEKIVATPDIRPAFVEQYRKLAGVLHHGQLQKSMKVVMVTSAMAGEGKTLTATNLALTFSESYRRSVLLIDADLRRPTLHETFQVPNVSGLGEGLRSDTEQKLTLVQVSPRLTLLTAGRPDPDPMSGLTSDRMRRVIEEASARFDWVIIDTPPVGLLPDAKLLADMADATLLVVRARTTPYQFAKRAMDAIGRERIFGVVLNRAEEGIGTGGYAYYSYYDSYAKGR